MDAHWKNCPPEETIKTIENLLKPFGIKLKTEWYEDENRMGLYSNFVRPFNTFPGFKSAGKGITPEYAQASGYAEFIERFQTFMTYYRDYGKPYFKDEVLNSKTGIGEYPYLNLITGEPEMLSSAYLFSTGMASGNTDEEAIVHAICEIVERQTVMDFVYGELQVNSSLPLNHFNFNFTELENLMNGKVQLFDVGRFGIPTVALICRNEMTRQLVFKIDCAPTLDLAVERCLTEFFQNNFSKDMRYYYWQGCLPRAAKIDRDAVYGILVDYHLGPIPGHLIADIEDAAVPEKIIDYNFTTEQDLIQQFIQASKEVYHYNGVYLRDFKWAGFPTVYLYIPDLINREHKDLTLGQIFSNTFAYLIQEYEAYIGENPSIAEFLMRELLTMYMGKPDPMMISKRYNNTTEMNPYVQQMTDMIMRMKEVCKDFAMDIESFKHICMISN
jgi:ribosomal protein S12 methylthiotransferase accessory factor YcaO